MGTTYPTNLRLSMGKMTEDQWVKYGKNLMMRPPMPWFNIRAMILPSIVDRKQIPSALALNSTQFNLSRILGPSLAGILMAS